jgi:hypothetical protein
MEYVRIGCACLIGLVFVVTAMSKARDFGGFARSLPELVPVRPVLVRPLAGGVVALEALVPLLIAVPPATAYGLGLAAVLLAAFTVAIGAALARGRRAPCRCFGASSTPIGPRHLARNGLLLTAAVLGALSPAGLPPLAGVVVTVAAGLVGAILVVFFDDIVDLFARTI